MTREIPIEYTQPRAVQAEGARIGIVTCRRCGAALVLDTVDDFDVLDLHTLWHQQGGKGDGLLDQQEGRNG